MEIPQTFAPVVIEQIVENSGKIRETRAIQSKKFSKTPRNFWANGLPI